MTQQAHGLAVWPEQNVNGAAISAGFIVESSPNVETFAKTGTPTGALVDDGEGGFTLTVGSTDYDGQVMFLGNDAMIAPGIPFPEADPDTLPGILAWGEAEDCSGVGDGNAVSTWVNKTLSGLDAAQSVAGQKPLYRASGIRGLPAIDFDGSNDTLLFSGAALNWFKNATGMTLMCVVQRRTLTNAQRSINVSTGASSSGPRGALLTPAGGASYQLSFRDDSITPTPSLLSGGTPIAGIPSIVVAVRDWAAKTAKLYVDGLLVASTTYTEALTASDNTASLAIQLGAATGASALTPLDGLLSRHAFVGQALDRTTMDPVLRRWSRKYSIPLLG